MGRLPTIGIGLLCAVPILVGLILGAVFATKLDQLNEEFRTSKKLAEECTRVVRALDATLLKWQRDLNARADVIGSQSTELPAPPTTDESEPSGNEVAASPIEQVGEPGTLIRDPMTELTEDERRFLEEHPPIGKPILIRGMNREIGTLYLLHLDEAGPRYVECDGENEPVISALASALLELRRAPAQAAEEFARAGAGEFLPTLEEAQAEVERRRIDGDFASWMYEQTTRGVLLMPTKDFQQHWRLSSCQARIDALQKCVLGAESGPGGIALAWVTTPSEE